MNLVESPEFVCEQICTTINSFHDEVNHEDGNDVVAQIINNGGSFWVAGAILFGWGLIIRELSIVVEKVEQLISIACEGVARDPDANGEDNEESEHLNTLDNIDWVTPGALVPDGVFALTDNFNNTGSNTVAYPGNSETPKEPKRGEHELKEANSITNIAM